MHLGFLLLLTGGDVPCSSWPQGHRPCDAHYFFAKKAAGTIRLLFCESR